MMKSISWLMLPVMTLVMMLISTTTVQAQVVTTVAGGGSPGGTARGHDDGKGVLATLVFAMTCDGNDLRYIGERTRWPHAHDEHHHVPGHDRRWRRL